MTPPLTEHGQAVVRIALIAWQVALLFAIAFSVAELGPHIHDPMWRTAYAIFGLVVWGLAHAVTEMIAAPWLRKVT